MSRLARDLAGVDTDDEPTPEHRAEIVAWANAWRARNGVPPLRDGWEDPPEEQFYRRARALGMARADSGGT